MSAPIDMNDPQEGFYKCKMVKGGPWVPVKIWMQDGSRNPDTNDLESDQFLRAMRNGQDISPFDIWTWCAEHPITEQRYLYMIAAAEWDLENNPDSPFANPRKAIDISKTQSIF